MGLVLWLLSCTATAWAADNDLPEPKTDEPPLPVPYEWISLRGQGDMSSSKGNVLSIGQALDLVPPEALRYLVMREKPQRTIAFDPGLPLRRGRKVPCRSHLVFGRHTTTVRTEGSQHGQA